MEELEIEARVENLDEVLALVDEQLELLDCPMKEQMQIDVAVEEIFVNIAHYAYGSGTGTAVIQAEAERDSRTLRLVFMDRGMPYNPLEKEDPDVKLAANERQIGGLGIFMVKKIMDEMAYEYQGDRNILTLKKQL